MKLSDFGLCKPLDCSNFPDLSDNNGYGVGRNSKPSSEGDKHHNNPPTPTRTQQEQLLHWQKNRRMLVCSLYLLECIILFSLEKSWKEQDRTSIFWAVSR